MGLISRIQKKRDIPNCKQISGCFNINNLKDILIIYWKFFMKPYQLKSFLRSVKWNRYFYSWEFFDCIGKIQLTSSENLLCRCIKSISVDGVVKLHLKMTVLWLDKVHTSINQYLTWYLSYCIVLYIRWVQLRIRAKNSDSCQPSVRHRVQSDPFRF